MKGTFSFEGGRELDTALRELPRATGKNVLRRAGRLALEPMRDEAAHLAPDDPGTPSPDLKTSFAIGEKRKASRTFAEKTSAITLWMGPTREGYPEAMVQEFGSGPHYVTKGGGQKKVAAKLSRAGRKMHPGNPPVGFMRRAWDRFADAALETIKRLLWAEIEKARARLARKAERLAAKMKGG